jgi:phospholipid/cholesterol/gamma-HCH transport system permease protein
METSADPNAAATLETNGRSRAVIRLSGRWKLGLDLPRAEDLIEKLRTAPQLRQLDFTADALSGWDSSLLIFLLRLKQFSLDSGLEIRTDDLPAGVNRLLELSSAVPERKGARREAAKVPFFARVGCSAIGARAELTSSVTFIGEAFIAFLKFLTGRARFRRADLFLTIQETGVQALPIVSLISLLVGLIFAFVGAIQLRMFGAQIYVADLVGIAMTRDMGAVMTGIIMAGRTGASFAAQLGTMKRWASRRWNSWFCPGCWR